MFGNCCCCFWCFDIAVVGVSLFLVLHYRKKVYKFRSLWRYIGVRVCVYRRSELEAVLNIHIAHAHTILWHLTIFYLISAPYVRLTLALILQYISVSGGKPRRTNELNDRIDLAMLKHPGPHYTLHSISIPFASFFVDGCIWILIKTINKNKT